MSTGDDEETPRDFDGRTTGRKHWRYFALGFLQYAAYIVSDEDKSNAIYRRFGRLVARNLLHLEAEVCKLEKRLDELNRLLGSNKKEQALTCSWDYLQDAAGTTPFASEAYKLILDLRTFLPPYCKQHEPFSKPCILL